MRIFYTECKNSIFIYIYVGGHSGRLTFAFSKEINEMISMKVMEMI